MANVVMKVKNVPVYEFYINNWEEGKVEHKPNPSEEYYLNFPDGYVWSVGSAELMTQDELYNDKVNIYRLKSDKDFDTASQNMLNSEWIWTSYKDVPVVKAGSVARDVYILHYRHYPQLYLTDNSNPIIQNLFNVAIRCDEDSDINNWLTYCESDQKWYEFNPHVPNQKNEVIGWVKSPYKLDITEIELAD